MELYSACSEPDITTNLHRLPIWAKRYWPISSVPGYEMSITPVKNKTLFHRLKYCEGPSYGWIGMTHEDKSHFRFWTSRDPCTFPPNFRNSFSKMKVTTEASIVQPQGALRGKLGLGAGWGLVSVALKLKNWTFYSNRVALMKMVIFANTLCSGILF